MGRQAKGGDFEREISKKLSTWWTKDFNGPTRDDVFWRSSQSGGRATQRAKSGKSTYGSYGDLAAVDPIGTKLLKLFTIELKRGSSYGAPTDLLDALETDCVRPFEACLLQAINSHEQARSVSWMLIAKRDRCRTMVYVPTKLMMERFDPRVLYRGVIKFDLLINQPRTTEKRRVRFVAMALDDFLKRVQPRQIMEMEDL